MPRAQCCLLVMLATSCFAASPLEAAGQPNILFLFADDQRADTIAAHGNSHIQTPNLDALVRRGFSFRNNYCFGSNSGAVCVPSRAMVHTGKVWMHIQNNMSGETTLGELLRREGYTTFATGKWHNQAPALLRSFERGKAIYMGGMCDHTQVYLQDIVEGSLGNKRIGQGFSSEIFADSMIEFLESQRGSDKPFFGYAAFTAPHDPRNPPERYRAMYYKSRPPLPGNFLPQHPFDNGFTIGGRDENLAPWPRTAEAVGDQLCEYYGLITHLDEQVGRVLKALEATGRADNTVVVYAADHGLAMGSHGLLGKQSVYEHSMRCPLIIAGPGIPEGRATEAFSYLHDIYPTLCSLTGIDGPAELEGHDLSAIWTGKQPQVRDSVFLSYQTFQRAVRDERWKLIVYPQINHVQFFDLQNDPLEMHNLADDPAYAGQRREMRELLVQWQQTVGDRQPLTVPNPKPKEVDLAGRARVPDRWQPDWIVEKYFEGVPAAEKDRRQVDRQRQEFGAKR